MLLKGSVDSILSWKYFVPLSKLSFSAYLVHMDLMYYHCGILKTHSYFSHFEMVRKQRKSFSQNLQGSVIFQVYEYFGNLIMKIPLTLFLYLAVDAPGQTLMRALFKKLGFRLAFI